jgi:hypothetical protein
MPKFKNAGKRVFQKVRNYSQIWLCPCPTHHRTRNWAVSGIVGLIGTEKSQDPATRHPIFSLISVELSYSVETTGKDQTGHCATDSARGDRFHCPNC